MFYYQVLIIIKKKNEKDQKIMQNKPNLYRNNQEPILINEDNFQVVTNTQKKTLEVKISK